MEEVPPDLQPARSLGLMLKGSTVIPQFLGSLKPCGVVQTIRIFHHLIDNVHVYIVAPLCQCCHP